jgi:hypothetical protein
MNTKLTFTVLCSIISTASIAQVYECIDSRGYRSYSESPNGKNCKVTNTSTGSFSVVQSYKPPVESKNFENNHNNYKKPAESSAVQIARQNLKDAQKALEEGKKIRLGRERNYVFYLNRIKGLEENVQARQEELNKAISQQE